MRVFALSDIHVDVETNARWVEGLSFQDYQDDVLILAGDISDLPRKLAACLEAFALRFMKVVYVPGNHDLWVLRGARGKNSFDKFEEVSAIATDCGVSMQPFRHKGVTLVPLLGWYDYSFGMPSKELLDTWMDFKACRWPEGVGVREISAYFVQKNQLCVDGGGGATISFSHFVPRIDLMPEYIPLSARVLYPVLGSEILERQIRILGSQLHVYGHSHVNRNVSIDGVRYVNNAFGYPYEERFTSKMLKCVYEL